MKSVTFTILFFNIILAQTSPTDFFEKNTPGLTGTISATSFFTPNTIGGLGHFQFRTGIVDCIYKYPTYNEWSYLPAWVGAIELGLFKGISRPPIISGILSFDLILRAGYYLKQNRVYEARPFYGGGIKVGIVKNSLVMPAVSLNVVYSQINNLVFGCQDPNLETSYKSLGLVDAGIGIGKKILGVFPYFSIGARYNIIKGEYIQRAQPAPEFKSYEDKMTTIAGLIGCEWNILFLKMNSELTFSQKNPGFALGFGHGF